MEAAVARHGKLTVLMANGPRAYREVITEAIRGIRPDIRIFTAEPGELDKEVSRLVPDLVVCDRTTEVVRDRATSWIELYPGYGSRSIVSVGGKASEFAEIQLLDLLSVIDQTEVLLRLH